MSSGSRGRVIHACEAYIAKMEALVQQLHDSVVPEDLAVRHFFASLSDEERVRFSSEFPQFMRYTLPASVAAEGCIASVGAVLVDEEPRGVASTVRGPLLSGSLEASAG